MKNNFDEIVPDERTKLTLQYMTWLRNKEKVRAEDLRASLVLDNSEYQYLHQLLDEDIFIKSTEFSETNPSKIDLLMLNYSHPLVQAIDYLVDWTTKRISYLLNVKKMPYIDTNFLIRSMWSDEKLKGLNIGYNYKNAESWLNVLAAAGVIIKELKQHPIAPVKEITTWRVSEHYTQENLLRNEEASQRPYSGQPGSNTVKAFIYNNFGRLLPGEEVIHIFNVPRLSWKGRFATFAGTFGIAWLFIEPISALGVGTTLISSYGIWGYLGLLVFSLVMTILVEFLNRIRLIGKTSLISISIILTEQGTRYLVKAPRDMKIDVFLELFLKEISASTNPDSFIGHYPIYNWTLLVNRNGKSKYRAPKERTIAESGIVDGDICTLYAKIKKRHSKGIAF